MSQEAYIRHFSTLSSDDVDLVGGKNASLGEMYCNLTEQGIQIPEGFATTSDAFWYYLRYNGIYDKIARTLDNIDTGNTRLLSQTGARIRSWILEGDMPPDLALQIRSAYQQMAEKYDHPAPDVAVRSSATAEDLPEASFAGQQETYLNIRGQSHLLLTCKQVFASLYTNRAISYRAHHNFDQLGVALSIGVQKMVRSDIGSSGVMFTLDTETGFRDVVFITASYGLGENIVQGAVNPDEFYVFKPSLEKGFKPIIRRHLGQKALKMIYSADATATSTPTHNVKVRMDERNRFSIDDDDVLQLARYACTIEAYYSKKFGRDTPMDIEWAKDGESGELFIVQARPETVHSRAPSHTLESFTLKQSGKQLINGKSVGHQIVSGRARVILEERDMHELQAGEILVTDMTDPDWEPIMKIAGGIITNRGGRTCHAAIIARELGIPAIVGTIRATSMITNGDIVTLSCAEGDTGYVYQGELEYERKKKEVDLKQRPKTKVMLNIGNPERAFEFSRLPNDGVGLARLEFIINSTIKIHPRALLEYDTLPEALKEEVKSHIHGYPDPQTFYVEKLAEGIGMIAAAFHPKPVIVRLSDFKSNEYSQLIGGSLYEPDEENPMLGFRGASRYPAESFANSFALECRAIRQVREQQGLDNVAIMIPFVRSLDDVKKVTDLLAQQGLARGSNGLKTYLMCEIPANALLADAFLEYCDGFSIGSNDLTQLTLGVDRDSGLLSGYDERNEAVKILIAMAIKACRAQNKYIGICGQAPSDFPEMTTWLIEHGIESVSLNPDSVLTMTQTILNTEAS